MIEDPRAIGPYRVIRRLGQGGMGVVYQAVSTETGHLVALKTVRVGRPSLLAGIRREIHLLARLRHPGVVRVVGEGVHGGLPWYAMELLDGTTLRQYMAGLWHGASVSDSEVAPTADVSREGDDGSRRWWTTTLASTRSHLEDGGLVPAGPPTVRIATGRRPQAAAGVLVPVLTVVRRLCDSLGYLHGEGLVHRDLKPENILMRPDGHPVLVDFGLMSRFGDDVSRDALMMMSEQGGTLSYMAPEQAQGDLVDARADLYALGCILYELVTGRPPFVADAPAQLLWMHRQAAPASPSTLVDGAPAELEALILRLMEKDRRERLGYADVVAAALARLGAKETLGSVVARPRSYLYRPRLAGRGGVMVDLEACVADARQGRGGIVLIGGESGVGKTRLAMEVAARSARSGLTVHTGACRQPIGDPRESGAGVKSALSALRPLLLAVGDLCREKGPEVTERLLGRRAPVLALYEPSLGDVPGVDAYPPAVELGPSASRLRLLNFMAETLAALCRDGPRLLVLDDLQWADDLTIALLGHLHRTAALAELPLLVIGTFRTEEAGTELRALAEADGTSHLRLERLDEDAVGEIVGDMLALLPPPAVLSRYLAQQSEGNPLFVAEYLRAAVAEGLLYRDEEGYWRVATEGQGPATTAEYAALPLPTSLREILHTRLAGLSPGGQTLLDAASVLGREVDAGLLAASAGLPDAELLEGMGELLARQVMEEGEDGRYRFLHERIREVAYAKLSPEDLRERHRRAAAAIEGLSEGKEGPLRGELGRHWERAGVLPRARACYLDAARAASARYSLPEAEGHYRAYLSLVEVPDLETVTARNELALRVLQPRGRYDDASAQHERALQEARRLGDLVAEGMCLRFLAETARLSGKLPDAERLFREVLEVSRVTGRWQEQCAALGGLALVEHHHGRLPEARRLYDESLAIAREHGDRRLQGIALTNLAVIDHQEGSLPRARQLYEETLAIARETGDRHGEGVTLLNLSILDQDEGRLPEAREHGEQALAIHREIGDRYFEGTTLGDLGGLLVTMGEFEEARRSYEQALTILRQVGNRQALSMTLLSLASVELQHFQRPDRADELSASAEAYADGGEAMTLLQTICERGHILLALGRSADQHVDRARRLVGELHLPDDSRPARALAKLARAVAAASAGTELLHGVAPEDAGSPRGGP